MNVSCNFIHLWILFCVVLKIPTTFLSPHGQLDNFVSDFSMHINWFNNWSTSFIKSNQSFNSKLYPSAHQSSFLSIYHLSFVLSSVLCFINFCHFSLPPLFRFVVCFICCNCDCDNAYKSLVASYFYGMACEHCQRRCWLLCAFFHSFVHPCIRCLTFSH